MYALRQAEGSTPVADVCRQLGVSEASFYVWKKKYAKLDLTELRELRQLRDENARLKRVVAVIADGVLVNAQESGDGAITLPTLGKRLDRHASLQIELVGHRAASHSGRPACPAR